MKGIQGLLIAVVLGLMGAGVNVWYLSERGKLGRKTTEFLIVKNDKKIKQGDLIRVDQLTTFEIPSEHAGNLDKIAYKSGMENTLAGLRAMRDLESGQIILRDDFLTPPKAELPLNENEVGIWVPVGRLVPSLLTPGKTQVSFMLPRSVPTPAQSLEGAQPLSAEPEQVGPFDVLSVGNRLGSVETMKTGSARPTQENVLTIRARYIDGKVDKRATRILDFLARTNYQPLEVILHPEKSAHKEKE